MPGKVPAAMGIPTITGTTSKPAVPGAASNSPSSGRSSAPLAAPGPLAAGRPFRSRPSTSSVPISAVALWSPTRPPACQAMVRPADRSCLLNDLPDGHPLTRQPRRQRRRGPGARPGRAAPAGPSRSRRAAAPGLANQAAIRPSVIQWTIFASGMLAVKWRQPPRAGRRSPSPLRDRHSGGSQSVRISRSSTGASICYTASIPYALPGRCRMKGTRQEPSYNDLAMWL